MTATQPKAQPSIPQSLSTFQDVLPVDVIRELAKAAYAPKRFYERIFAPAVMVWCLVFQRLNADHSCDAVLSHISSGAIDHLDDRHRKPLSQRITAASTSAFCQARHHLLLAVLTSALRETARQVRRAAGEGAEWLGHPVALLDGSTITLRPFGDLPNVYGHHANQHGPTYWVEMRLTVAFCLLTGAVLAVAEGSLRLSEQLLARTVLADLPAHSVCVADQNFGVFSVVQAARHAAVFVVVRLTATRARALAKRSLSSGLDLAVLWAPSRHDQCAPDMSLDPVPGRLLALHLQRDGFRPVDLYVFTTLLDTTRYPLDALCQLYGQRWHVELNLRYVKATLDLGVLAAKSADTVRKELFAGLIAYNVIRAYMTQAAQRAHLTPLALSFTQCWRRIHQALAQLRPTDTLHHLHRSFERLMARLAECRLPERLRFRIEPRAVRKRRATYPPLKGPRDAARQRTLDALRIQANS